MKESLQRLEGEAEMETRRPDPASLAAGPSSLLLDGSAHVLEGWGQVGIRTVCKDRTVSSVASRPSHLEKTSKEDKPSSGSPPELDAERGGQGHLLTFIWFLSLSRHLMPHASVSPLLSVYAPVLELPFRHFQRRAQRSPSGSVLPDGYNGRPPGGSHKSKP